MASTFRELYDDFLMQTVIYVAALPITEPAFMRLFTRGMQIFQRETMYADQLATLTKVDDGTGNLVFQTPDDFWQPIELRDVNDKTIMKMEFTQQRRNVEYDETGYLETPVDYSLRLGARSDWAYGGNHARSYSVFARRIILYPDDGDTTLYLQYVPDIVAFSTASSQWAAWNVSDTAFTTLFNTARVDYQISMWESNFLDYAIAQFLKSRGSSNFIVYENSWQQFLKSAKELRPAFYSNGVRDYHFAPYS